MSFQFGLAVQLQDLMSVVNLYQVEGHRTGHRGAFSVETLRTRLHWADRKVRIRAALRICLRRSRRNALASRL